MDKLNKMKVIVDKKPNGLQTQEFTQYLTKPVPITNFTVPELDELQKTLSDAIDAYGGVGIAANQLGILKRVCLIKIEDVELFLVNPVITKRNTEGFIFYESCLSIPSTMKSPVKTIRACSITVQTDNMGELHFEINTEGDKDQVSLETMQTVVVQHEIDHLDGINIKQRVYNPQFIKKVKYGRNDRIVMKSPSGELIEVKYKKANDYFLNGYEIV